MKNETNPPSPEAYELPEDALSEVSGGTAGVETDALPLLGCKTCSCETRHRKLPDSFSWQCTSCGSVFYYLNQIVISE